MAEEPGVGWLAGMPANTIRMAIEPGVGWQAERQLTPSEWLKSHQLGWGERWLGHAICLAEEPLARYSQVFGLAVLLAMQVMSKHQILSS
eukprot:1868345-Amphidinium_carterae.1